MRLPLRARRALALPIRGLPLPILKGPARGSLWSVAASGRGVLTGRYENTRFSLLAALIDRGDRVWDVGAHRGYATLIAASRAGPEGRVLAFEPASMNRWYLERHLRWNRVKRVQTFPFALGAADGESTIGGEGSSVSFRLGDGSESVQVRSARSLVENDGLEPPTLMKIDVEGAEGQVLEGAAGLLGPDMLILLSIHSAAAYATCAAILRENGLAVYRSPRLRSNLAASGTRWHADPDLVAVGGERRLPAGLLERYGMVAE